MPLAFRRSTLAGLVLIVAVLLGGAILDIWNTRRLDENAAWVVHSQEVLNLTGDVLRILVDAETGARGFLITGNDEFLQPYEAATQRLDPLLAALQEKTRANPVQQERIGRLKEMAAVCMNWLTEGIELRRTSEAAARARTASGQGKAQMDAIRQLITEMEHSEQDLLQQRQRQSQRASVVAQRSGVLTAVVGLFMVAAVYWVTRRSLSALLKAASLIEQQHEWLRTTLSSIGDAVIATDTVGRVTLLNHAAQTLTGWNEDEATGRSVVDVFRILNEQTRQEVENPALRAMKERLIVGLTDHTVLISKTGSEFPVDGSAAPIRDAAGELIGCVLVFRDMTERTRAKKERADAEARIRSMVNHVIDGIITIDEGGTVESINPAAENLFGYAADEVVGQNVRVLMPEPFHSEHDGYLANYLRTGQAKIIGSGGEVEGRRKDGSRFPMELTVSEFRLGLRRYFTGIARDITERKQAEAAREELLASTQRARAALEASNRAKDEFLAMLGHELRNPLSAVRNAVATASLDESRRPQALDIARRQTEQLGRLIDDLLDVARITQGRITLRKERVYLAQIIERAVESTRSFVDSQGVRLAVSLASEPIRLEADPARLEQVFVNLLSNAAKYTAAGGRIDMVVERCGEEAVVRVRDTGIGIAPEVLPHVWDLFTQADRALDRAQGGLGVGLTVARRLVELHGARIEAHSEGIGKGAEFVVCLPALPPTREEARPVEAVEPVPQRSAQILIVEDNPDVAESLVLLLELLGHRVCTAYDGITAMDAARANVPDVMLVDIGLPGMDGYEVARCVRRDADLKHVVLVALTGYGRDEDKQLAMAAGFDYHLVKPVDPGALHGLVARLGTDEPKKPPTVH